MNYFSSFNKMTRNKMTRNKITRNKIIKNKNRKTRRQKNIKVLVCYKMKIKNGGANNTQLKNMLPKIILSLKASSDDGSDTSSVTSYDTSSHDGSVTSSDTSSENSSDTSSVNSSVNGSDNGSDNDSLTSSNSSLSSNSYSSTSTNSDTSTLTNFDENEFEVSDNVITTIKNIYKETIDKDTKKPLISDFITNIKYIIGIFQDPTKAGNETQAIRNKIVNDIVQLSSSNSALKPLFDDLKKAIDEYKKDASKSVFDRLAPENKEQFLTILNNKAHEIITMLSIKDELSGLQMGEYVDKKKIQQILKSLQPNGSSIGAFATSVSSSFLNGAIKMGEWFSMPTSNVPKKNRQKIQLYWYPRSSNDYAKGESPVDKNGNLKSDTYGEFVIVVDPEQYATTSEYLHKKFSSVEDLLVNMIYGCTDLFCQEGFTKAIPRKRKIFTLENEI